MARISIKPTWVLTSTGGDRLEPQLFRLLRAVHETGKLTLATERLGLSYRHAWALLAKWANVFGAPLVWMERGKGAQLTSLGEKFLWAEQRMAASLFPQLENIASELNAEIGKVQPQQAPSLRIHASHCYVVEKLPESSRRFGGVEIELRYMGSTEALASLTRAQCHLAGFHIPIGEMAPVVWASYAQWIRPAQQRVIRLVTRTQGLIVTRGNPLKIRSLADMRRRGVKVVNRQPGSGTRLLFDGLLRAAGIDAKKIVGYDSGEFTHAAVAAFVASGVANVGLGVEPAARQFNLDFIPLITERYMLACNTKTLVTPAVKDLIALLKDPAFGKMVDAVPGYAPDQPGAVIAFEEILASLGKLTPRVVAQEVAPPAPSNTRKGPLSKSKR